VEGDLFFYVEEVGSGTNKIINWCKDWGLPEPEFGISGSSISLKFRKDIFTEEYLRQLGLNERQIKAVMYVKERGKIANREYQIINNCFRNTATNDLTALLKKGVLKQSGKKVKVPIMSLHNNCIKCTLFAQKIFRLI